MALMLSKLNAALLQAGATPVQAQEAAEEVASYESQFAAIKLELVGIKGDVALLKWMLAFLIAGVASLVVKAFA